MSYLDQGANLCLFGDYRFLLWRRWAHAHPVAGVAGGTLLFVMLNPSTADASEDDRTLLKCIKFAQREGFGAVRIVNLFALRTPNPKDLAKDWQKAREHEADNLSVIEREAGSTAQIVVAWGQTPVHGMDQKVLRLLRKYNDVYCLGRNDNQTPKHPLYLKETTPLELYLPRFEVNP